MGRSPSFVQSGLLWLTVVATVVGVLPQFNCVCPNGQLKRISYLTVAFSPGCCCQTTCCQNQGRDELVSEIVSSQSKTNLHSCCSENLTPKSGSSDNAKKCSGKGCKRELVVVDSAITSADNDINRFEHLVASLAMFSHTPQSVFFRESRELARRPLSTGPCPPPDLIISLCHLVI